MLVISCVLCLLSFNMVTGQLIKRELLIGQGKPVLTQNLVLPEVYNAFLDMAQAAKKDGIKIEIVSGYRSYQRQLEIWNRKFNRYTLQGLSGEAAVLKIIEYSTIPGTSRHHWGTEIDITDGAVTPNGDILVQEKFHNGGPYENLHKWMTTNAHRFGFVLTYTRDPHRKGFLYEPWHYSYEPFSVNYLKEFLLLDLTSIVDQPELLGKEYLTDSFLMNYLNHHIKGIDSSLIAKQ